MPDMIAARQELDLRPQLERLDRLILRSAGLDPAALTFAFRPLWQLDAASAAAIALQKAQATQIYAGLGLWPAAVTARLVEAQLVEDGTYPNAAAAFAENGAEQNGRINTADNVSAGAGALHYLTEPRKSDGKWTVGASSSASGPPDARFILVSDPEKFKRQLQEEEAGGPGPLEGPALPQGEDPLIKPLPGAATHGPLETVPSPMTAITPFPRPAGLSQSPPTSGTLGGIVGPGPFAREGFPAGPSKRLSSDQRRQNNANGYRCGCHWCGSKDPGTTSGDFVGDHQLPTSLNFNDDPQTIYPHCDLCSKRQGGFILWLKKKGFKP